MSRTADCVPPPEPQGELHAWPSLPDIGALHRNLRWGVLGLVGIWMIGTSALNLIWTRTLVEGEFQHHMTDQARALANVIGGALSRHEDLARALAVLTNWPGRTHEVDILDQAGSVLATTGDTGSAPDRDREAYGIVVAIASTDPPKRLRLWMSTESFTSQYRHVAVMNLAAILGAGLLLAVLMGMATTRAGRGYEMLLRQVEQLEASTARMERLEGMGRMAAGVAHEIRNPLNALGLGLQRIRGEFLPTCHPPAGDWVKVVEQLYAEVRRLDRVVEDFLSLARPIPLAPSTFDLVELIRQIADLHGPEAHQTGVELQLKLPATPMRLTADRDRIGQALVNLIRNAIQATAGRSPAVVRVEVVDADDSLQVEVSDSGVGPQQDGIESLFELFYTTKPHGTGLGLCNARRIAESHRGSLDYRRKHGWTTFTLRLPVTVVERTTVLTNLRGGESSSPRPHVGKSLS